MVRRPITRLGIALSSAALVLSLAAGSVSAGEITGNGKPITMHAKSLCAFSGLNDHVTPEEPNRTQNYGEFVRIGLKGMIDSLGGNPGTACNPTKGFAE